MCSRFNEQVVFDKSVLYYINDYAKVHKVDVRNAVLSIIEEYKAHSEGINLELDCAVSLSDYVVKYAKCHDLSISNCINKIIMYYRAASYEIDAYIEYFDNKEISKDMKAMTINSINFFSIDNNENEFDMNDCGWM